MKKWKLEKDPFSFSKNEGQCRGFKSFRPRLFLIVLQTRQKFINLKRIIVSVLIVAITSSLLLGKTTNGYVM
jgi:hypothetical protein